MVPESQIPIASQQSAGRFARPVALFYGALFGLLGSHLPFFPVWLRAVGIDAAWIGVITAVPAVTRFTALPFVTGLAEQTEQRAVEQRHRTRESAGGLLRRDGDL